MERETTASSGEPREKRSLQFLFVDRL